MEEREPGEDRGAQARAARAAEWSSSRLRETSKQAEEGDRRSLLKAIADIQKTIERALKAVPENHRQEKEIVKISAQMERENRDLEEAETRLKRSYEETQKNFTIFKKFIESIDKVVAAKK